MTHRSTSHCHDQPDGLIEVSNVVEPRPGQPASSEAGEKRQVAGGRYACGLSVSAKVRLRVAPELADHLGAFEIGEHGDVERVGSRSGSWGRADRQDSFDMLQCYEGER